ncbi:MAG: response regulator [Anaerolineales bacterium]
MSAANLIVGDDEDIRESLERDLDKESYQVRSAAAGQEALEVLKEKEIALIIFELKLPDIHGVEVMRQVDLAHPQTQLVIPTAERSFESAVTAVRGGAVDYLLKP